MRPVLFVVCFTLGVSLMVISGYVPHPARARGTVSEDPAAGGPSGEVIPQLDRTVTRPLPPSFEADLPPADLPPTPAPAQPPQPDPVPPVAPPAESRDQPADSLPPEGRPATSGQPNASPPSSRAPDNPPDRVPDEPAASNRKPSGPVANAGPDRVVWIGWDLLELDGSGSTGEGLKYRWRQLAGPVSLIVADQTRPTTTATGLLQADQISWRPATYKFELTVTDEGGARDTDTVQYVVKSAPGLVIRPPAQRHFEYRDGYQMAHYTSWTTNLESYEAVFEITSRLELNFTRLGGGVYEVAGGKNDGHYVYQVTLYGQPGEATSWVELFVDNEEKIPGIVQLGVNWER